MEIINVAISLKARQCVSEYIKATKRDIYDKEGKLPDQSHTSNQIFILDIEHKAEAKKGRGGGGRTSRVKKLGAGEEGITSERNAILGYSRKWRKIYESIVYAREFGMKMWKSSAYTQSEMRSKHAGEGIRKK